MKDMAALLPAISARALFPFLAWWPMVNRATLRDDLIAGLTGALIVLPQGVAFATIAGLPPEYGLYAAMIPAIVAALWGSSWHLVSGPTTAISIAVFAALSHLAEPGSARYIELVLTMTFLVGVFQLALGLARMGVLVNFISHTVVIGFTSGAAILIAASQVGKFFGLNIARGAPVMDTVHQLVTRFAEISPWVAGVGLTTLLVGIATRKRFPKAPYMIVAMVVGALVAAVLNTWKGVDVTGIRTVGALPSHPPPFSEPSLSWEVIRTALPPAVVITMLALTEAVSISRSIAVRSEQRIDGNQEFIGQGLSNLVGAFFSCYASSGSFNRSGVNYESGARTPMASIFASAFLVLVLLLVAPLAAYLPTAAMAGILFLVAWGLIDFHHIKSIWRTSKAESLVLWATLIGTLVNLEAGIFLGVIISLVMYLHRSSKPEVTPVLPPKDPADYHFEDANGRPECPQLRVVRINGSVYFGAVSHVQQVLQQIDEDNPQQKSVLISANQISFVDVAGAEMFAQEARRRRRMGGGLYFYRLRDPIQRFLRQGEYVKDIGEGSFFPLKSNATGAIYWTLDPDVCRGCRVKLFKECQGDRLPDGFRRQRIMLATDGRPESVAARDIGLVLARRFGVTMDVMTSVPTRAATDVGLAQERLDAIVKEGIRLDVDCERITRYGHDPIREVVAAAEAADTNILVIGRRPPPSGVALRFVGDSAARIITGAASHVLVAGPEQVMWSRRALLVADASRAAEAGLELAAQIARISKVAVAVAPFIVEANSPSAADLASAHEEARLQAGLIQVEGIAAEALGAVATDGPSIVALARDNGCDLIVLAWQESRGISRRLLDTTLEHVLGHAGCPVLIVKYAEEELISLIGQEM